VISKAQLVERKRGKGGTVVRLRTPHPLWGDTVVVKDLMDRRGYDRPDRVGVGPADRGITFGVSLADIEAIVEPGGRSSMDSLDRIATTNGFIEADDHTVPRNPHMRCSGCETWLTLCWAVTRVEPGPRPSCSRTRRR